MNYFIDIAATADDLRNKNYIQTVWKSRKPDAVAFAKWLTSVTPVVAGVGKDCVTSEYYFNGKKVNA